MGQFWMVWNENSRVPRIKHQSQAEAEAEALRLFEQSPADKFYVLAAVEEICAAIPPMKIISLVDGSEVKPSTDVEPRRKPFTF